MIERDYLMRMISMLAAVLLKLMGLKNSHDYPKALMELETASRQILGIPLSLLEGLPEEQLLDLYKSNMYAANAKLFVAGVLIKEKAAIAALQGQNEETMRLSAKALRFLLETFLPEGIPLDDMHLAGIEELLARLQSCEIPASLQKEVFAYYECRGQFDKAENTLYELLDRDPHRAEDGVGFYERLLAKDDGTLAAGNLPRKEVEEGLRQLRER